MIAWFVDYGWIMDFTSYGGFSVFKNEKVDRQPNNMRFCNKYAMFGEVAAKGTFQGSLEELGSRLKAIYDVSPYSRKFNCSTIIKTIVQAMSTATGSTSLFIYPC